MINSRHLICLLPPYEVKGTLIFVSALSPSLSITHSVLPPKALLINYFIQVKASQHEEKQHPNRLATFAREVKNVQITGVMLQFSCSGPAVPSVRHPTSHEMAAN